jgi:N utilization substance protein A
MVKLNNEETKLIMFFQQATGAIARDVVDDGENMAFVVSEGEVGRAVGPGGKNVAILQQKLKRNIAIVEWSEELERFVSNVFFPTKVDVEVEGDSIRINTAADQRKYVIGRGGYRIKLAKLLVERNFRKMDLRA